MDICLATSLKILVLLNPFAVLSTYLALTEHAGAGERRRIVLESGIAVLLAGILLFFSGSLLFKLIGIDLNLFKVGGGVILMICAVSLVWGSVKPKDGEATGRISVVPLAIPMAVGPGTTAGLIIIGLDRTGLWQTMSNLLALLLATAALTLLLLLASQAEKVFKKEGIAIITKLSGLLLSAIAAQMILEGVKGFLVL